MFTKANAKGRKIKLSQLQRREAFAAYSFLVPAVICMAIFLFTPMLNAMSVSLNKWDLFGDMKFVGLDNYKLLISGKEWWKTLQLTFTYVFCFVPSLFVVSLLLALIVKHIFKFTGFFRTSYFAPIILSAAAAGIVWKILFDSKYGAVNLIIGVFGGNSIPWLAKPSYALIAALIVHVWLQMGYYMIIFLSGLQDIPADYYEAGKLDGANGWQSFRYITFPCLSNTSVFVLVMSIIISFQAYDQVKLLTNGGPANSTRFAVQYIHETAFVLYDMGKASAMAIMLFIIVLVVSIAQIKITAGERT